MKNKIFQSRDLCLRALDTNSLCAKNVRRNVEKMDESMKVTLDWIHCPKCGGKTRTQVRPHTVLENFPLFCPKCKYTCVIHFQDGKIKEIKMPDA